MSEATVLAADDSDVGKIANDLGRAVVRVVDDDDVELTLARMVEDALEARP